MKILMIIMMGLASVNLCVAATFDQKKQDIINDVLERIGWIHQGIEKARKGTGYFHERVCQEGVHLSKWITKINKFATDYPKNPQQNLLKIDAWLNDCDVDDVKDDYGIKP